MESKLFQFFIPRSLRNRLMAVTLVMIIVPTALTCIVLARQTRSVLLENNNAQIKVAATMASSIVKDTLDKLSSVITLLLQEKEFRTAVFYTSVTEDSSRLKGLISRILSQSDAISGLEIYSKAGKVIYSSKSGDLMRERFQFGKSNNPRYVLQNNDLYGVVTRTIVLDDFGDTKVNQLIVQAWVSIDSNWISDFSSYLGMDVFVQSTKQTIIASSLSPSLTKQISHSDFAESAKNSTQDLMIAGSPYQFQFIPVQGLENQNIAALAVGKNTEWIEKKTMDSIIIIIIAATSGTILILGTIFLFLARQTRSLKDLAHSAYAIKSNGPEAFNEVEIKNSDPVEISTLSFAFNSMANALRKRLIHINRVQQELMNLNLSLEERVRQKTMELERSTSALIQTEKMAALGVMASGIAHEINNPLFIIQGTAERIRGLLECQPVDTRQGINLAEKIEDTTKRISKIVLSLRTFARDTSGDPFDYYSVQSIVEETLEFCRARFKANEIDFRIITPPESLEIECRIVQICQVLLNLLSNSFDAIQGNEERWIEVSIKDAGEFVDLVITDSGKGISVNIRESLFQPFFTTKEVGKGTGLGLSVSKGIIDAHHGQIWADYNHPNTRFILRLPKKQIQSAKIQTLDAA